MSTKKFLAVFDGLKYSPATAEYAVHLAGSEDAYLAGVFLDDFSYHSYSLKTHSFAKLLAERKELQKTDSQDRSEAAKKFQKACDTAGLNHITHHDPGLALPEILHESMYADLLVINKNEAFTQYEQHTPTAFVRDVLAGTECPVLVVPNKYNPVNKIVMLYDGAPASVYAIKLFSYIFPSMKQLPVNIITVKPFGLNHHLPENRLIKELINRHFTEVEYTIVEGEPYQEIMQQLKHRQHDELVVLGAYQRTGISRWFRPSMADQLMCGLKTPLFVAHR